MTDNTPLINELLREGLTALENEDHREAQTKIQQAIKLDPHNTQLWFWCAKLSTQPSEQLYCYQRILHYEPANEIALEHLSILRFLGHTATVPTFLPATTNATINLKGYILPSYTSENNPFAPPNPKHSSTNDPIAQMIISKIQQRFTEEDIVRYLSSEYSIHWEEAEQQVHKIWAQYNTSAKSNKPKSHALEAAISAIIGLLLIFLAFILINSLNRIIFLCLLGFAGIMLINSIVQIIKLWSLIHRAYQRFWHKY